MRTRPSSFLLAGTLLLTACGGAATPSVSGAQPSSDGASSEVDKAVKLRLNTAFAAEDTHVLAVEAFVAEVKDQTDGVIDIAIFPSDGLAASEDAALSVSRGTYDLDMRAAVFYESILPAFQLLSAPFSGLTGDEVLHALAPGEDAREIIDEQLAEKNVKILSMWSLGWPGIVSMEPLNTIDSFAGKHVRMASQFIGAELLRAHGAEVVLMSGSEAVDALNRGVIDGGTSGPLGMISRGYPAFAKYWQMWPVDAAPVLLTMNLDTFDGLSAEQQDTLVTVAEEVATEQTGKILSQDMAALDEAIDQGITELEVSDEDRATLAAQARPLLEEFARTTEPTDVNTRVFELLFGDDSGN